jgi:hypothetical protein
MNLWTLIAGLSLFLGLCEAEIAKPNLHSRTLTIADIPPCGVSRDSRKPETVANLSKAPMHVPHSPQERVQPR